jgi:hypothetical protein
MDSILSICLRKQNDVSSFSSEQDSNLQNKGKGKAAGVLRQCLREVWGD